MLQPVQHHLFTPPAHTSRAHLLTGAVSRFVTEADVMASLIGFARSRGVALFAVLLATWGSLLSRYSNQESKPE